jgi:hypothetical protein
LDLFERARKPSESFTSRLWRLFDRRSDFQKSGVFDHVKWHRVTSLKYLIHRNRLRKLVIILDPVPAVSRLRKARRVHKRWALRPATRAKTGVGQIPGGKVREAFQWDARACSFLGKLGCHELKDLWLNERYSTNLDAFTLGI